MSDFDLDGLGDDRPDYRNVVDCEGVLEQSSQGNWGSGVQLADARGWLMDLVSADDDWNDDGIQCHGTLLNRGTEYDWLRFWWDMLTDEGIGVGELANIYDRMDPRSWDLKQVTPIYFLDDPVQRLESAASAEGRHTEYMNQRNNGVHH